MIFPKNVFKHKEQLINQGRYFNIFLWDWDICLYNKNLFSKFSFNMYIKEMSTYKVKEEMKVGIWNYNLKIPKFKIFFYKIFLYRFLICNNMVNQLIASRMFQDTDSLLIFIPSSLWSPTHKGTVSLISNLTSN